MGKEVQDCIYHGVLRVEVGSTYICTEKKCKNAQICCQVLSQGEGTMCGIYFLSLLLSVFSNVLHLECITFMLRKLIL